MTSIPKKRFSECEEESIFPTGRKAHCKNAYGLKVGITQETGGAKMQKGVKKNQCGLARNQFTPALPIARPQLVNKAKRI